MDVAPEEMVFHHTDIQGDAFYTIEKVGHLLDLSGRQFGSNEGGRYRVGCLTGQSWCDAAQFLEEKAHGADAVFELRKLLIVRATWIGILGHIVPLVAEPSETCA